ncbi:hypothetical protein [Streptomyces sp. NPDC086787]|uniref:hypothetical protein n=1 Tax=Streptomyces sp. NPDC086787 TaxID=3365759 RepID=UPI0037FB67FF
MSRSRDAAEDGRSRRLNPVAALAFTVGGALFAVGAGFSELVASATQSASIYFTGGLFFNTGGYASLLETFNAPGHEWRWWSYEPMRKDWLSAFTLLAGTVVFGVNLLDSFMHGLTVKEANRLVWAPDLVGCLLFLLSGHLAFTVLRQDTPGARGLGWWITAVNQFGSVLFLVSALAAFTRPATGSLVNAHVANWGTLTGAVCFSVAGVLQLFTCRSEAPPSSPGPRG